MARTTFAPALKDPRRCTTLLDACAFDPKFEPETSSAFEMLSLYKKEKVLLIISHSVESELEHPGTPAYVKKLALELNHTYQVDLTKSEIVRLEEIKSIMQGDAMQGVHDADANHVFHAGKWGGYFVTTDKRILNKRASLQRAAQTIIVTPTEWLSIYSDSLQLP